jgi:hypothetical protein
MSETGSGLGVSHQAVMPRTCSNTAGVGALLGAAPAPG